MTGLRSREPSAYIWLTEASAGSAPIRCAGIQGGDGTQLIGSESSPGRREVLTHALRVGGLGNHDVVDAQVPAQHDLHRGCPASLRQRGHRSDVQICSLAQRTVSLDRNPLGAGLCAEGGLLESRVKLNLLIR
jgi:hypothetical protein